MQQLNDLGERPLSALPPRERIRKTASDLFCQRSIHTVGIDRIIAESGVAKMTFYKHFPPKACLIADFLQSQTGVWMQMLISATQRPGLSPVEQVLAIFDALDASFQQRPFRGCPFVKGMAEFGPDADAPEIQAMIDTYFDSLDKLVTKLIEALGLSNPGRAAIQILAYPRRNRNDTGDVCPGHRQRQSPRGPDTTGSRGRVIRLPFSRNAQTRILVIKRAA